MKQTYKISAGAILFWLVLAISRLSWAGGSQAYTNGSEGFGVGNLPPPSLYYIHYTNYYHADDFKDNSGDNVDEGPAVTSFANIPRFLWVTPKKILGGDYATHIFIPIVYSDVDFDGALEDSSDDKFGLGNIIFSPFIVGWHRQDFHFLVNLVDIFFPTRTDYDNEDAVNLGNDFWTFEPIFAFTYQPGQFEVSAKFMYDISTKDDDHIVTGDEASQLGRLDLAGQERTRKPGQEFHVDYLAGYHLDDKWTLAAVGYFYQQVTDDEISGDDVNNRRGRVLGLGPGIKYNFKDLSVIGKVYFETMAKNRNEGISAFFKLIYKF